jgi:hypothetical protein
VVEENSNLPINSRPEIVDEMFVDSRVKIDCIIILLAEKLQTRIETLMESDDGFEKLTPALDHLERVIMMRQMNVAKTKDLLHLAPKKYKRVLTDDELKKELRPVRDTDNFPRRGPRGPREDAAGEAKPE